MKTLPPKRLFPSTIGAMLVWGAAAAYAQTPAAGADSGGATPAPGAPAVLPPGYFDEPAGLAYDEETQNQKHEDGVFWREFRFTSLIHQDVPIRIHAVYAVPDAADTRHKVPGILMTHGIFGYSLNDPYKTAITLYARAGYAVLFIDWYPDWAANYKPKAPADPIPYTTFGKIDYLKPWYNYWHEGNDWKDSLPYQFTIAAKRGITWLQARPEVQGDRIGATGASYGGIFSSMLTGIDTRVKAANPVVYTAGFGKKEESYNHLPDGWTDRQVDEWRVRFDSDVSLRKRSVPILYTIGANDPTFLATKAMNTFGAMNEPKHLLIGPNRGHDYWDIPQGILFFDSALKGTMARPVVSDLKVVHEAMDLVCSVKSSDVGSGKVEFFFAPAFEIDPDLGSGALPADLWKWTKVDGVLGSDGIYKAKWTLPFMRPMEPKERIVRWDDTDALDDKGTARMPAADKMQGLARVFVRVTDAHGAMECTPISEATPFNDPLDVLVRQAVPHTLPKLEAAVRVKTKTTVALNLSAAAGRPVATFDLPLAAKAVGAGGYVLWNWSEQNFKDRNASKPIAPRKRIDSPFVDAIKPDSFQGGLNWGPNAIGGQLIFVDHDTTNLGPTGTAYHGSMKPGMGGEETLAIPVKDDQEHTLTLVMAAPHINGCNLRVSLTNLAGNAETLVYHHTAGADAVIQFRFKGDVTLHVQTTSQPTTPYNTLIGPSAIFLD